MHTHITTMPKITQLLAAHRAAHPDQPPFAFEYYPPRTDAAVAKLYQRLENMARQNPLYVDFTWGESLRACVHLS